MPSKEYGVVSSNTVGASVSNTSCLQFLSGSYGGDSKLILTDLMEDTLFGSMLLDSYLCMLVLFYYLYQLCSLIKETKESKSPLKISQKKTTDLILDCI